MEKANAEDVEAYSHESSYANYYYREKCQVEGKANIRRMCVDYIKVRITGVVTANQLQGLFWILSYYHHDCPSWDW